MRGRARKTAGAPSRTAPARVRRRAFGTLALAGVFLLKLTVLIQLAGHPLLQPDAGLDTTAYAQLAREVLAGNVALGPGLYYVSPLYIYFLAAVLKLTAGSFFWVRLVQISLGTTAVWLIFRTAERWHGRRAAWIAGALAALTGLFTFYEILILQAALDPFLTALGLALFASSGIVVQRKSAGHFLSGLVFGIHTLNRPNIAIAVAGMLATLVVMRRWRVALLVAAGVIVALGPLTIRNYAVAGDLAPVSSHGGLNFYIGNNSAADGTYRAVEGITPSIAGQQTDARRVAEEAVGRALDDSDVSAYFYGLAWSWIAGHPVPAIELYLRKLAYVFNAAHLSLNYSYRFYAGDEPTLLRFLVIGPWLVVPLGLLGMWLAAPDARDHHRAFLAWVSFVPFYAVAVAAFFVSERYRLPLLVPLCVTAGGAVDALIILVAPGFSRTGDAAARFSRRRAIAAMVALAILSVACNWRPPLDEGRAEERTRMALWLIGHDRFEEAEARVVAAQKDHPEPGLLHFRVGRALLARRQPESAIPHLEQALAKDPERRENDYALGQALLDAGRAKDAIPHLRRAVEAGVRIDLAGFDLARAYAAAGDEMSALRVLQTVRPARADDGESWRALGQLALNLQSPRLAESFLRQAVQAQPSAAESREQLGVAIALTGRYPEAIAEFEQAVHLDPASPTAHLNLAVAYAEVGRLADARMHAQEAIRLDPSYKRAKEFLGALGR